MNRFIKKTRDFIFAQQTGMISSTLVIASMLLTARFFGFARYRVLNNYFTREELDIFYAGFRIPDFLFEMLIAGALTTTFIPFFLKYTNDPEKQNKIASSIINILLCALAISVTILMVCMPYLVKVTVLGFDQRAIDQVTWLSRMLLISQLPLLVIGNIITGLSQANRRFLVPAFATVLYNLGIVVTTYLLVDQLHLVSVFVGVTVGAFLFLIVQIPILFQVDFHYRPSFAYLTEIKEFFRTVLPRLFTTLAAQIEASVDQSLSSLISPGAFTTFYYAQHLQLLPVSIIGMAFGQASLPYLSEMYQNKKIEEFKKIVVDSLNNLLFITVPIMVFFIVARTPLVRLVFGGDRFDWAGTVSTADTMSYFALSIPFHSCYYFLTRCYYATFDSKTPFLVSIFSIALNASLSYIAVSILLLPVWALGITFSIAISIQVCLLFWLFSIRMGGIDMAALWIESVKITTAAALAFLISYPAHRIMDGLIFDTTRTINLVLLLVTTCSIMFASYVFACWTLDARGLYLITQAILRIRQMRRRVTEIFFTIES